VRERALKATIAACVLGAAVVAVWAAAWLRDDRSRSPEPVAARREQPTAEAPSARPASRSPVRSRRPLSRGKPLGDPQVMPPSRPILAATAAGPAPPSANLPSRPEEAAVRRVLEPLVARRPNAEMPFVRCQDPGGWKRAATDDDDPLDVRARDPEQAVCRARLQARERGVLVDLLRDASGAYQGHLVATDVREHLDAYLGRWFQVEVQLDTEEPYPLSDALQ
jgi:hypothetical protein